MDSLRSSSRISRPTDRTPRQDGRPSSSLRSLSLASRPSPVPAKQLTPSHSLPRRASVDFRSSAPSPAQDMLRQRPPSAPMIRKHSSLASLTQNDGPSTPQPVLRRRSSLLSVRSSPGDMSIPAPLQSLPRDLTPPSQDPYAETTVILHDSSYKHRYSRPKTSLAMLESIVERPERIPAAVFGICAAQILAGKERLSINKTTRMGKLSDPEVMLVHAHTPLAKASSKKNWPDELTTMCGAAEENLKRGKAEVPSTYHQGDLYLCGESLEDLEGCVGAVYDGVDAVFGPGSVRKAFICIRPPGHHCAEREPSGFCWLNNVHIAIAHAAKDHGLTHAVILDFDLHHGDGSQAIAWSINELATKNKAASEKAASEKATTAKGAAARKPTINVPNIGYFSLHDINSYPCEHGDKDKIINASINLESHGQFIHNIHLQSYSNQEQFWHLYEAKYSGLFAKAREFLVTAGTANQRAGKEFRAGIFISAGFDASEHESQGMQRHKVHVPTDFFAKFTADAVSLAEELCEGHVLSVLEGGYSDRALTSGVFAHISGLSCVAPDSATFVPPSISLAPTFQQHYTEREVIWSSEWWALARIEELERLTIPHIPRREKRASSYMDSTAASVARIAEIPRRTSSSHNLSAHAPLPPKPWEVQTFELSHYFIPQYEESVAIPAAQKPGRQSAAPKELTMKLRDRRPKTADPATPEPEKMRRRTTISGPLDPRIPTRSTSRASSVRSGTPAIGSKPGPTTTSGTSVMGTRGRAPPVLAKPTRPTKVTRPSTASAVDVDELSGKLAKVKITFNKEKAEQTERARIKRLEQEKIELEKKLEKAVQRRGTGGATRSVSRGPAPSSRVRLESATTPPDSRSHSSGSRGSVPSSPLEAHRQRRPVIELNGMPTDGSNDNAIGVFHGVVGKPHGGVSRDQTFRGGEIKFGRQPPFGAGRSG